MDTIGESLFHSFDTDHNGVLDWKEMIIGLSAFVRGDANESAKGKSINNL